MNRKGFKLRIKKTLYETLKQELLNSDGDNESFCFLYCFEAEGQESRSFFPNVIVPIDHKDYSRKDSVHLQLKLEAMHKIYTDFIIDPKYTCLISCHSHPFDDSDCPHFSQIDDNNDEFQANWFYKELIKHQHKYKPIGTKIEYLHLVMSQNGINVRRYNITTKKFERIEQVGIYIETGIQYMSLFSNIFDKQDDTIFSRTDCAFGNGFTKKIKNLTIGLVGLGGLGSIIAEGLSRLGIKNIILIDPDKVEETNLNRLQGFSINNIGEFKVNIVKKNLEKYFPDMLNIITIKESLFTEKCLSYLKDADIIIGAVDNHKARFFLNRFSVQYLIPYIDAGTRIVPSDEKISVKVRVGIVIPSVTTCFDCSLIKYYSQKDIFFEYASENNLYQLKKNGYILDNNEIVNPAVYPQNMTVSGIVLLELMNIVSNYKPLYNNIAFDYSSLGDLDYNNTYIASTFHAARRKERMNGCINCDNYLGVGDNVDLLSKENIDITEINESLNRRH